MPTDNSEMNEYSNVSEEAAKGMKLIAESGGTKFTHLCLYNSLARTGSTAEGIEGLMVIYSNLLALHGFMAGFQFIALEEGEIKTSDDGDDENSFARTMQLIVFSCRVYGFLVSLLGTLICLITQEYLKTMQHESIEAQVGGMLRYCTFFQYGDYTAILATILLGMSPNLLIWNDTVPVSLAIATNVITLLAALALLRAFYVIIIARQKSRILYNDPNFITAKNKLS